MKNNLSAAKQKEGLQNALEYYSFPKKFFIHPADQRNGERFAIATEEEHGAIQTHTGYMSYEEFNCFLSGFNAAKQNKFNF